jgi:hypothetical protein
MSDVRPAWPHKEMTEHEFRVVRKTGMIVSVEAHWKMTSEDTSREWLTVKNHDGNSFTLPSNWAKALKFVGYSSSPGLFGYTYEGDRMQKTLSEIDAWEKKNAADRTTYERLKAKFGKVNHE